MGIVLRPGTPRDAAVCGPICFEAFKAIDDDHNFPWDFPSAAVATDVLAMLLSNPGFYSVVAEKDGNVIGSNFLDERGPIAGIGPITVDPASQNGTIGRRLMEAVLDRASQRRVAGVRLLQSAFHNRSLCLYTKLGFDTRETVSKMNGTPLGLTLPGYEVRPARPPIWRPLTHCASGFTAITVAANSTILSGQGRRESWSILARSPPTRRMSGSSPMPLPRTIGV
jgi:predicted N-acetyltransferase YhbS